MAAHTRGIAVMDKSTDKDLGTMFADAAQEAWEIHREANPRVQTLLNAVQGGRLTFEQFASAMFGVGWITGFGTGYETHIKHSETPPSVAHGGTNPGSE